MDTAAVLEALAVAIDSGRAKRVYLQRCTAHHSMMIGAYELGSLGKYFYRFSRVHISPAFAEQQGLPIIDTPLRIFTELPPPETMVGCSKGCLLEPGDWHPRLAARLT